MTAGTRMCRCMTRRRAVAAQRVAARLAGSQVHPAAADLFAFLADATLRLLDVMDRRQVCTRLVLRHLGLLEALTIPRARGARTRSLSTPRPPRMRHA